MDKPQVEFVESKGLTINLPSVGAPVAVRAEGEEVVILVRLTLRPRDYVVNIDLDVSASGNGAAVPGLDENAAADVSRYWRAVVHQPMREEAPNDPKLSDSGLGARVEARRREAKARAVPGFMAGSTARD